MRDPLLDALIAKLPEPGKPWGEAEQYAWLRMWAMGLGVVYGGNVVGYLDGKTAPAPAPVEVEIPKPNFYIDESGYAMNKRGKRVKASEVTDVLYDFRGEDGDVGTIVWADDSIGLNGADLTISAV